MAKCKYKAKPRYNVVCVRVSDEERDLLERLSLESDRKVSDLLREALMMTQANLLPKKKR